MNVLQLSDLRIEAKTDSDRRTLVEQVSLVVQRGEMVALVGESGSGKSVTASAILGLLPRSLQAVHGRIELEGVDLLQLSASDMRKRRGVEIGYIFQDYNGSFSPFRTIGSQMTETLRVHRPCSKAEAKQHVLRWLERVQLPAERVFRSYPFQLSGGQKQRAALAAALQLEPKLLIADEPTTALDVLNGELVMELLHELRRDTGCAVLLISHDLRLVLKRADRIAVMREGRLLEQGSAADIRERAAHPYTQRLLMARPLLPRPAAVREEAGAAGHMTLAAVEPSVAELTGAAGQRAGAVPSDEKKQGSEVADENVELEAVAR
ncbi:ABC transporter ATP-binding protein [Paenibacillus sp. YYML68]|uniref:ABC transporter ATP-binding protein n=1 Tax=Paenibacillus sp. YYML68 TaxID=2909250 RepID=UPI00249242C5|nr:ABC transporter ATP-binding protein [Paenibacillus sp. YYML68]